METELVPLPDGGRPAPATSPPRAADLGITSAGPALGALQRVPILLVHRLPHRAGVSAVGFSPVCLCVSLGQWYYSSSPLPTDPGPQMESIEVDGVRVAYERVGAGPPLVLLHGYVGDGATTWGPQLAGLSDEFTVIAWDAPGAGRSSDPPESFGMRGYADCLAGFIERLGLHRPHVAGMSFGGALAIEFCRRHPAVPATAILVSAYAGWAGSLPADAAEQRLRQAMRLAELPGHQFVAALLPTMFSARTPPRTVAAFESAVREFHPSGFRAMAYASAEDLRDALPDITVPTLLVYGDADVRAPLTVAEALHAAIVGSTLVVLPGAGHVCTVEAPNEFNQAVRGFLRSNAMA